VNRSDLVSHARDSIARGSKSFAFASKIFEPQTRERVWLLYAWCRKCDDMADGQDHGGAMAQVNDPLARLAIIRDLTAKAMNGEATGEPAFDCLGLVAAECELTHKMAEDVIAGFALDTVEWRPQSESDLYQYCYHVAGAVGVMMAVVMGVSPDDEATLDRACDLGLAFQLANISRDLAEDDAAGRCYLPQDWLIEMDIPQGQSLSPIYRERLALLAKRMCDASERYEASARVGAAALPLRSRWAVLTAAGVYGDIAREVRRKDERAWDQRVYTSKASKLGWMIRAGGMAMRNTPEPCSRDGLWTRGQNA
jgi:15-cis-phytoene synthase